MRVQGADWEPATLGGGASDPAAGMAADVPDCMEETSARPRTGTGDWPEGLEWMGARNQAPALEWSLVWEAARGSPACARFA